MNSLIAQSSLSFAVSSPLATRLVSAFGDQMPRTAIEKFIEGGFFDAYGAKLESFLPLLLHFDAGNNKGAALGLGKASKALFIEQYLTQPIELALGNDEVVSRSHIAELGNLFSLSHHATVPLFMVVSVALYQAKFRYLCFSGTEKVRAILTKYTVPFLVLGDAKSDALGEKAALWGSYYQHKPQVCVLDLQKVVQLIEVNSFHYKMMQKYTDEIAQLLPEVTQL
ncbi:thermostable hemolysin [Pseudoalteromonas tunicata]|uniref:thermostable hemolysin n=1 Tax=Pseudoalteromonas tunicata TaxID=314281 RepID=UPI0027402DB7|nr:thermostable hemolysin [Pseudoalteromonas tunicata]MDP5213853.1 thermostable hemolysin [Pseudoalteromonas tunicata]